MESDGMEWELSPKFHSPAEEIGGIKTGGSDEETKHTPRDEPRHLDDEFEHARETEVPRDDSTFPCEYRSLPQEIMIMN
jgi:hypothetical protein